ncbi:Uncharacterised protein [[Clostridium] sordellii]|uniref:hypothetical protein n=1 Tax=Paraclostridium sordellii TaxID=1505 RepID=UPI0005DCD563|nr:hypothetical protein [Paeniclostridium sordellii]CEP45673.1 Uncharacterised protein [[Clostridium] sordellii] [Paeniclostridium sordellii]
MSKQRVHVTLDKETMEVLNSKKRLYGCSLSESIEYVVKENKNNAPATLETITDLVRDKIVDAISKDLKSIKFACNSSDMYSKIVAEMLNGHFMKEGNNLDILTTDIIKSKAFDCAYSKVKKDIETNTVMKNYNKGDK